MKKFNEAEFKDDFRKEEYSSLIVELSNHKAKLADLPELISKITFTKNRIKLLQSITRFLKENNDIENFKWLDSSKLKKKWVKKDKGEVLAQFSYKISNPHRCLTIYRKYD